MEILEGSVKSVVYHNPENGYTVLRLDSGETVVGNAQAVWEGENISASGQWVSDKVHGRQFKAESLLCVAPKSVKGIEKYLASGLIRGLGPKLAKAIVDKFGEDTLEVLSSQSAKLLTIPKIGKAKVAQIRESWRANEAMRENMIFGQTYGISILKMSKIVRRYGPGAIEVIKSDPYRLCDDIWGIGFSTADRIALNVGIPKDSLLRARAVMDYALAKEAEDGGHCWTFENDLLLRANELTGIPVEILGQALELELEAGRLVAEQGAAGESRRIYQRACWWAEREVARRVKTIVSTPTGRRGVDLLRAGEWWQSRAGIRLANGQLEALERSLSAKFSIITGGPGVGKTTVIRALVDIFKARREQVVLSAPTGRAAKRMSEAVGMEAKTIHRLLKWNPGTGKFTYNSENRHPASVFIFDETSMIDIRLAADLLSALPDSATVVWVGDTDQLPSVGAGNVLADLIRSGIVPFTRLEVIFRQDASGLIVRNAHRINAGEPLELGGGPDRDFYMLRADDPEACIKRIIELMTERIPAKFGLDPFEDIQILTPMRKNTLGADNLNFRIQEVLQQRRGGVVRGLKRGAVTFCKGDRVMQLRNNYDKDVFNGDVGFVLDADGEARRLVVAFDGRPVVYSASELDELVLAYAITVHKSQGSEYPASIVVVHTQHYVMLERNLLYTAVTRGKKLVMLIGVPYAIDKAIKTNTVHERRTSLAQLLASNSSGNLV